MNNNSLHETILQRLFHGRLNRSGFLAGSFYTLFGLWMIGEPVITVSSIIFGSQNGAITTLVVLFFTATFLTTSLSLRRFHDLSKSGNWLLLFMPGYFAILLGSVLGFVSSGNTTQFINLIPAVFTMLLNLFGLLSLIISLYLFFWPGTNGENDYGTPKNTWEFKEIFGLIPPKQNNNIYTSPTKMSQRLSKLIKISSFILLGLIVIFVVFVLSIFLISYIQNGPIQ